MAKTKAISCQKSPDIAALDGRAICLLAAEHVGASAMLSESVVCLPHDPKPRAHRCKTDFSALVQNKQSKYVPSVDHELARMRLVAGSMLRKAIAEKEPNWFQMFVGSGRDLLMPLDKDEVLEITLVERSVYPFQWVFENTQCRVLREYLEPLLALPAISRAGSPWP